MMLFYLSARTYRRRDAGPRCGTKGMMLKLSQRKSITFLLSPKVVSPSELGQFRHISLCNVIYKIASKVLANRLKKIFFEIIS